MMMAAPIKVEFLLVKVEDKEDSVWDVCIFGDQAVLKAFEKVYQGHYVEKSVFEDKPMIVIPEFPNESHAEVWKEYWMEAFNDPDNACKSCPTVTQLFETIGVHMENKKKI